MLFVSVDAAVPQCDAQQEGIKSEKENVESGGRRLAAVQRNKNKQEQIGAEVSSQYRAKDEREREVLYVDTKIQIQPSIKVISRTYFNKNDDFFCMRRIK